MARKPKRMALYEAIRQGQMKIADGLKTGQMRSDGPRQGTQKVRPMAYKTPDVSHKALLESEDKSSRPAAKPSKAMMVGLGIAAQALILGLGIWLGVLFMGSDEEPPVQQAQGAEENVGQLFTSNNSDSDELDNEVAEVKEEKKSNTGFFWNRQKADDEEKTEDKSETAKKEEVQQVDPVTPVASSGDNVIVIQSRSPNRENELRPLQEYFKKKGIETRIIVDDGDYRLLVTQAGFKRNPGVRGTDGYALYNRIRQLGLSFVDETGITDFGTRPFQDIYGYKLK